MPSSAHNIDVVHVVVGLQLEVGERRKVVEDVVLDTVLDGAARRAERRVSRLEPAPPERVERGLRKSAVDGRRRLERTRFLRSEEVGV